MNAKRSLKRRPLAPQSRAPAETPPAVSNAEGRTQNEEGQHKAESENSEGGSGKPGARKSYIVPRFATANRSLPGNHLRQVWETHRKSAPRIHLHPRQDAVLSPDEIAGKLSRSKPLVIKLIESGQLGAISIGTGKVKFYRVPAAEWEKFLRNRAAA